jgi:hypothetical protein
MEISGMTSLDIANICEGLIDQMQHQPIDGTAFKTWSKIAIQAFQWEPDEYAEAAKEVQAAADKRRGW